MWQILMFYSVWGLQLGLFISLQPDVQLRWGLDQNVANRQVVYIKRSKLNIADMWLIPLIVSHYMIQWDKLILISISLIAFHERVTFWLERAGSLPCACVFAALYVRLRTGYTQAYVQIMQHTHTHKAVTGPVEAKKVTLSSKAIEL